MLWEFRLRKRGGGGGGGVLHFFVAFDLEAFEKAELRGEAPPPRLPHSDQRDA